MSNPLDFMLEPASPPPREWTWATVVSTSPLAIRLDGDTSGSIPPSDTLVDPLSLSVGSRVRVHLDRSRALGQTGARAIIVGVGGGTSSYAYARYGLDPGTPPSAFPLGITVFATTNEPGWPELHSSGYVISRGSARAAQVLFNYSPANPVMWMRVANGDVWGPWNRVYGRSTLDTSGIVAGSGWTVVSSACWAYREGPWITCRYAVTKSGSTLSLNEWGGITGTQTLLTLPAELRPAMSNTPLSGGSSGGMSSVLVTQSGPVNLSAASGTSIPQGRTLAFGGTYLAA